ncbi:MAG TPA: fumarylacetoacetate hydrolase family protein [Steroidobacteraceae bacterium]
MSSAVPAPIAAAAQLLLAVRRGTAPRLAAFPPALALHTVADAYAVQFEVLRELGTSVAGWKATLFEAANGLCAPLGANALLDAPAYLLPARLPTRNNTRFGIEAEIAFRLGEDLPPLPGGARYERAAVSAAIASAHAAIEVMVSRFIDSDAVTQLERIADNFMNELLILGPSLPEWRALALADLALELRVDGKPVFQGRGGHPLGDPLLPVIWLANHLHEHGRQLRAGEIVTTGSCSGLRHVQAEQSVSAFFTGLGTATVRL